MPKHNKRWALLLSDSHAWFNLGLCNPNAKVEPPPQLNETQNWLWNDVYIKGIDKAKELVKNDDLTVLHVGDITHGNGIISEQVNSEMAPQFIVAADNFDPIFSTFNVKQVRIAIGTGLHSFGSGTSEAIVSTLLKRKYPKADIKVIAHGLIDLGGFTIDVAHHGPSPGGRNWLKGNEARLYLRSRMMDELDYGEKPANLFLRGHYHTYIREWATISRKETDYESWLIIMPPLCMLGFFGQRVMKSIPRVSPGILLLEIIDGKLNEVYKFIETLDWRSMESL